MAASKTRLAVLDDYQGIAFPIFSRLSSRVDIECFPETINTATQEGQDALVKRLRPFTAISAMRERTAFPRAIIEKLPNLKLLITSGMKNAAIDMAACAERGIIVAGAKGIGTSTGPSPPTSIDSTLEHCWALILGLSRNVSRDDAGTKMGQWENSHATGLRGKTLAVLGFGNLGARVAFVGASAFGMKILAWSSSLTQAEADKKASSFGLSAGAFTVAATKEDLVKRADVLTIHYVLSERSRDIVGSKELGLMKPTAMIVNTSRGPLINEQALLDTLAKGLIKGAALDVYNIEPLPLDSPWRTTAWGDDGRSEVLLSPHMGYVEEGVMTRWYEDSAAVLETWLEGKELSTRLN